MSVDRHQEVEVCRRSPTTRENRVMAIPFLLNTPNLLQKVSKDWRTFYCSKYITTRGAGGGSRFLISSDVIS